MSMITLLTYDRPHRKTEDVLWRLISRYEPYDIAVVATPWVERKPRKYLYCHRPAEDGWPTDPIDSTNVLCEHFGIEYLRSSGPDLAEVIRSTGPSVVVVGGASILPKEVTDEFSVLNVHPGLLPKSRGLDILKWTILDGDQVGVTAHLCDERTDLGFYIMSAKVPVYRNDTFHLFALRQYEMELAMIVPSLEVLQGKGKEQLDRLEEGETIARMRMPRRIEAGLLPAFERYKLVHAE